MTRPLVCILLLDGWEAAHHTVLSAQRFGVDVAVGVVGEERGERSDGVAVYHLDWRDDFGDARNQLAARVTADWLLWLNDDEELVEYAQPEVERLDEPFLAVWIEERGDRTPRPALRLQRRHPGVRWIGAVHETPVSNNGGKFIVLDEIRLKCFGYENPDRLRTKLERNRRIADRERATGADSFAFALAEARYAEAAEHGSPAFMAWLRAFNHADARPIWPGAPDPRVEPAEKLCAYDYTEPARRLLEENPAIVSLQYALLATGKRAWQRLPGSHLTKLAGGLATGKCDRRYSFPRRLEGANAKSLRDMLAAEAWARIDRDYRGPLWANSLRVGRYVVFPIHTPVARLGRFGLRIDAGSVFGTGRHPSTQGPLLALDRLARRRRFRRVLDVGTGSGITAIVAAKTWLARVTTIDVNPIAVEQARINIRANRLGHRVRALHAYGFAGCRLPRAMDFELVLANLNTKLVLRYADTIARNLVPGGVIVLSGLLDGEDRHVAHVYRARGLRLQTVFRLNGWSTVVLEAPWARRRSKARQGALPLLQTRRGRG